MKKLVLASATKPLNLGVLATGLLAGMVASGMNGSFVGVALLGLAVLAYAGMVGMDLQSQRFVEETIHGEKGARRLRIELSEEDGFIPPAQLSHGDLRATYEAIVLNFGRAKAAFHSGNAMLQDSLRDSLERCLELVKEAGKTAQKGVQLRAYLDSQSSALLNQEAERLRKQAAAASDAAAKSSYQQATEAKEQQLATYRQIEGLHDRVNAQLSVILTTLDTVNAKLVKLRATDLQEAMAANESIRSHLETVSSDIHILESTVDETMQEFTA